MQRVKDWLIKKLGGYTAQEYADQKYLQKLAKSRWYEERAERWLLDKENAELKRMLGEVKKNG